MSDQRTTILDLIAGRDLPIVRIGAGDKLFLKGDQAPAMFVVVSGSIEVLMLGRLLERVGPGGIVGEMALIDGNMRCAAALTAMDTELVAIEKSQFLELVREEPRFALAVLGVLTRRLQAMNARDARQQQGA